MNNLKKKHFKNMLFLALFIFLEKDKQNVFLRNIR